MTCEIKKLLDSEVEILFLSEHIQLILILSIVFIKVNTFFKMTIISTIGVILIYPLTKTLRVYKKNLCIDLSTTGDT